MSILNKYKDCQLKLIVNRSNIMDIVVSDDVTTVSQTVDYDMGSLIKDNLIAYINASVNNEETETSYVQSLEDYFYKEWTNSDENICLLDDELTAYDNRMLTIDEYRTINDNCGHFLLTKQDKFLKLYPITNDEETVEFSNDSIIFNGGFLQGYYKLFGFDYNTLPLYIENDEWNLEFLIKPQKQRDDEGIFFYMGTRAENKFANFYNTKETTGVEKTSNGVLLDKDNYYEIKTNNKYLPEIITGYTREYNTDLGNNAYLIFSQNSKDYTVDTIEDFYKSDKYNKPKYNILNDLYYNCFSLFVTNDGEIGYRYLVNNCKDSFAENFIVETTNKNTINFNEWSTINVKIKISSTVGECNEQMKQHIMKIYIYVNGYLRLISKELPEFNFRNLDDIYQKQEMVPYNISIGGGTLGLSESKLVFEDKIYELEDPGYISTYFNKRFYGELRTFKFYNGPLSISDVRNNYFYNKNSNNIITNIIINGPVTVIRGDEFIVSISFEPVDAVGALVSWKLNDDKLEIVNVSKDTLSCTIKAIENGSTSISASVDGSDISDTFNIVIEKKPATEIIISGPQSVVRDEEFECHATIIPEDADDVIVNWVVDSAFFEIVNVSEDTLSCTVKAIGKGNASISASVDGNSAVSDTLEITVNKKAATEIIINGPISVVRDDEFECYATIVPDDADDVNVIWEVDSTFLEIVNISEDTLSCTIKAIKKGNASISVSVYDGDISDTFNIVIEKKPVTETVNDLNLVNLVPSMIKYDNFELGEKSFYALYNNNPGDNDIVVPIERVIKTPRFNIGELSLELEHIFDNNTTNTWVDYFSEKKFIEVTDDNEITEGEYLFVADYSNPKVLSNVSKNWGTTYTDSVEVKYSPVLNFNYIDFSNDLYNACCCTVYKSKTSEDKWNIKMPPPTNSNEYIAKTSSNGFVVSTGVGENNDMILNANNNNNTCLSFSSSPDRYMYLNNTGFRFYKSYSNTYKQPKMFKLYSSEYCSIGAPSLENYDAPIKTIITPYVKDCLYNYVNLSMDSTGEFRVIFHFDENTSIERIVNGETDIVLNTSEQYNLSELRVEIISDGIQHSQISFKKLTIYYNN